MLGFHNVAIAALMGGRIKGLFLQKNVWVFRQDKIKWP